MPDNAGSGNHCVNPAPSGCNCGNSSVTGILAAHVALYGHHSILSEAGGCHLIHRGSQSRFGKICESNPGSFAQHALCYGQSNITGAGNHNYFVSVTFHILSLRSFCLISNLPTCRLLPLSIPGGHIPQIQARSGGLRGGLPDRI